MNWKLKASFQSNLIEPPLQYRNNAWIYFAI